jgi:hypothetical protein
MGFMGLVFQADKIVLEMERKCDQKLVQCKEESRRQMMCVQGDHAALVCTRKYCKLKIEFNHYTEFEAYKDLNVFFFFKNKKIGLCLQLH